MAQKIGYNFCLGIYYSGRTNYFKKPASNKEKHPPFDAGFYLIQEVCLKLQTITSFYISLP